MEVMRVWQNAAAEHTSRRVVGFVPGYGAFDMRHGVIYRVFEGSRNMIGSARPATQTELTELNWAATHGALQIEIRPITGVFRGQGGNGVASAQTATTILYQARGIV